MITADSRPHLFSLHGQGLRLSCASGFLSESLNELLGDFALPALPPGAPVIEGIIRLYQPEEVIRRLPSTAAKVSPPGEPTEIYQHDELYWLIDDRWGMAEINLLKGQWRSWILPQPSVEPERCMECAVMWPLAQLLRGKGLSLVPAASCVRDGWGVLIIPQGPIEAELTAMIRAGYRVVGQRWTALREENSSAGKISMLRVPGKVERNLETSLVASSLRPTAEVAGVAGVSGVGASPTMWIDLTRVFCGASEDQAACDAVMLMDRGRRPVAHLKALPRTNAVVALRRAWPIMQLHSQRRLSQLHARLARECRCFEARLSRNPQDMLRLLDDARHNRVPAVEATVQTKATDRRVVA